MCDSKNCNKSKSIKDAVKNAKKPVCFETIQNI